MLNYWVNYYVMSCSSCFILFFETFVGRYITIVFVISRVFFLFASLLLFFLLLALTCHH